MTDNPGDPLATLGAEADRAYEAVYEAAMRYAEVRTLIAAELLRVMAPGAALIVANVEEPGCAPPSIYRVLHEDGSEIPEDRWIDDASTVEDELGMALHYCDLEPAGWKPDGFRYRLTLPRLGEDEGGGT